MKKFLVLTAICALSMAFMPTASAIVDLELALVMDGSGSISASDWTLQLQGYNNAITDSSIVPQDGSIAIGVIQFSTSVVTEIPMTIIDGTSIGGFSSALLGISQLGHLTNISGGIQQGESLLLAYASDATRQIIDVSTDGAWNQGIDPLTAAQTAVGNGVDAVNAIGVGTGAVLGFAYGANSFEMTAADFDDFQTAIRDKLAREVTGGVPEPASLLLLGSGLLGLVGLRRKKA